MSSLFKHTIQPVGSTTSPVEDLALEVNEAFDKLENIYNVEPKLLNTFREAIGNVSLEDLQPHKVSKSFEEVHNILQRESSFQLKAIPEPNSLSISYVNSNGQTVVLTEVQNDFTDKDQFKVTGKLVKLNLFVPALGSISLSVSYRGEVFSLGGKKFLPNVFKNSNGVFKFKPTDEGSNTYKITLDRNINDLISEFKVVPGKEISIFSTENGEDWNKIKVDSYDINNESVTFTSTEFSPSQDTFVSVFVENTSIGALINSLYKEFVEHKHGTEEVASNISSYDLSNRVSNNERVSYKSDSVVNYQFPQYLNREGHRPDLDSVYENAMLGNLFLSREMREGEDKFKGLDKDSYKITFGDPSLGHALGYSREYKSLLIKPTDSLNGLKIQTLDPTKWTLSLNGSEFSSNPLTGLKLKPEAGRFDLSSETADKNTLTVDNIIVKENADMHNVRVHSWKINDVWFKEADNEIDAEIVPLPNILNEEAKIYFKLPALFKSFTTEDFNVDEGNFKALKMGKVTIASNTEDNVDVTGEDNATINFNNIKIVDGSLNNIKVGDINLTETDSATTNGKDLTIHSTVDSSIVNLKAKTKADDLSIVKGEVTSDLFFGDVYLHSNTDKSMEFSSDTDKPVIFNVPVEFKNITTDSTARILLNTVDSDSLVLGNNKFHKDGEDTAVTPINNTVDTTFKINTKTKILRAIIDNLEVTEDLVINRSRIKSSNYGKVKLEETPDEELLVSSEEDKRVIFTAPVELNKALIRDISVVGGRLEGTEINGMKVGKILFAKNDTDDSLKVTREDNESKYLIEVPTEVTELTAGVFNTTGASNMEDLTATSLTLGGVKFTVDEDQNANIINKHDLEPKKIKVDVPVELVDTTSKVFSTPLYKFFNKDKIEIDEQNYLYNKDGRFALLSDKAMAYIGSDKNSGIMFSHEPDASYSAKQYISANAGSKAISTEKNFFFETDTSNGVYFIKNTNSKISVDGTIYGFNDVTAQRNISDLTKWFRSDLFVGKVEGTSINLKTAEGENKNGLTIGSTRLSVMGPGEDCPEGLTVLESGDSIHFVQPMGSGASSCRDLTYQEVSTGSLTVKGSTSIDGSLSLTEDFVTNGTVATDNLVATGDTELNTVSITSTLKVGEKATFNDSVEFKNPLAIKNELTSDSIIRARHFEASGNSEFQRDVEISRDLNVGRDVAVGGQLSVKNAIKTDGEVKANLGSIDELSVNMLKVSGDQQIQGTLAIQGSSHFKSSVSIDNKLDVLGKVEVKDDFIAENIYGIKEIYSRGKLTALDGADIKGSNISIGDKSSLITLDGKLQFNTTEVVLNSPMKIFESLRVSGDLETTGVFTNKSGINAESFVKIRGSLITDSNAEFGSEVKAKTLSISQNASIEGSLVTDSVTAESIAVDNIANVAHLNVTQSLSTSSSTRLNVGETHTSTLVVTDAKGESSFAGKVSISGSLTAFNPATFSDSITVGTGNVVINNSGITSSQGKIHSKTLSGEILEGTSKIQAPSTMTGSSNRTVVSLASSIPGRGFIRMNNFVTEGIAVFNNPVIVDTLLFRDLVYMEDTRDLGKDLKGVNITARRAVYA